MYIVNSLIIIDFIQGVMSHLSFPYSGLIHYKQKDDDWIVTLFVVKDLEIILR